MWQFQVLAYYYHLIFFINEYYSPHNVLLTLLSSECGINLFFKMKLFLNTFTFAFLTRACIGLTSFFTTFLNVNLFLFRDSTFTISLEVLKSNSSACNQYFMDFSNLTHNQPCHFPQFYPHTLVFVYQQYC